MDIHCNTRSSRFPFFNIPVYRWTLKFQTDRQTDRHTHTYTHIHTNKHTHTNAYTQVHHKHVCAHPHTNTNTHRERERECVSFERCWTSVCSKTTWFVTLSLQSRQLLCGTQVVFSAIRCDHRCVYTVVYIPCSWVVLCCNMVIFVTWSVHRLTVLSFVRCLCSIQCCLFVVSLICNCTLPVSFPKGFILPPMVSVCYKFDI